MTNGVHGNGRMRGTQGVTPRGPAGRRARRRVAAVAAVLGLSLVTAACTGEPSARTEPSPSKASASQTSREKVTVSVGVYGPRAEVDAFRKVVDAFNRTSTDSRAMLRSWPDHAAFLADARAGKQMPDVFLTSRADLSWLSQQRLNRPVDDLLDERGVDFGDDYSRDALEAYSYDNRLQCLPYGVSPTVIYYNKSIIDFDRMREKGLPAPNVDGSTVRWNFEQFAAAAAFGTRPVRHTKGLYVAPTLHGLAPFIYSGGGSLYDDAVNPTSLTLSDGDSQSALERTLRVLRDPRFSPTEEQLSRTSALKLFEQGRLGMIEGDRSLVPVLRKALGLEFDVMPMPVLDTSATVGDISGLCLSSRAASTPEAADFLLHASTSASFEKVAQAGYLLPANLEVALSDSFLQRGFMPAHASVFNSVVRTMQLPPLLEDAPALQRAVAPDLRRLVTVPVLDLEQLTRRIDERSRAVLAPTSESPSPSS